MKSTGIPLKRSDINLIFFNPMPEAPFLNPQIFSGPHLYTAGAGQGLNNDALFQLSQAMIQSLSLFRILPVSTAALPLPGDVRRQMHRLDAITGQNGCRLNGVFQLTNIPGLTGRGEQLKRFR